METQQTIEILKGILQQFEYIEQRFDLLEQMFKKMMEVVEILVTSVNKRMDESIDGVCIELDDL